MIFVLHIALFISSPNLNLDFSSLLGTRLSIRFSFFRGTSSSAHSSSSSPSFNSNIQYAVKKLVELGFSKCIVQVHDEKTCLPNKHSCCRSTLGSEPCPMFSFTNLMPILYMYFWPETKPPSSVFRVFTNLQLFQFQIWYLCNVFVTCVLLLLWVDSPFWYSDQSR